MSCTEKYQLLDLYFHEGKHERLAELSEHAARCPECRAYLSTVKRTMNLLSTLGEEEPSEDVIEGILSEITLSHPKPAQRKTGVGVIPVLQIAFGQILLFALIYFIKIELALTPVWAALEKLGIVRSIGSLGVSVVVVLLAGSFVALALAPVLLMDANNKHSYN